MNNVSVNLAINNDNLLLLNVREVINTEPVNYPEVPEKKDVLPTTTARETILEPIASNFLPISSFLYPKEIRTTGK